MARFSKKKKNIEYKISVLIFYSNFFWNIFHYRKNWARYDKNIRWYSCKVPVILVRS